MTRSPLKRTPPSREILLASAVAGHESEAASVEAVLRLIAAADTVRNEIYGPFLTRYGISEGKFTMLAALLSEGPQGMSALASRLGVAQATVSVMIKRMLSDEEPLIERVITPEDRRGRLVRLTEKGAACIRELLPEHHAFLKKALAPLSDEDRETLIALLKKLG